MNNNGDTNYNIENMLPNELTDKKILKEIFNIYGENEYELTRVCNALLERAKSFNSDELYGIVRNIVSDFLEVRRKKLEKLEDKKKKEEWHNEVRDRKELEEKRREEWRREVKKRKALEEFKKRERENARKAALELKRVQKEEREEALRLELEELKKALKEALIDEKIISELIYKSNGDLDGKSPVNYDLIVQNDKFIHEHMAFNEFTNDLEFDGEIVSNRKLLEMYSYFDRVYKLRDPNLIWNALNRPGNVYSYHPIKNIIEYEKWDGTPRIDEFFMKVCNVSVIDEDMRNYYKEVARMLFYGGIKRLYEPGCKFDYMIILEGRQGTCKTTLVRLLALDDSAYSEVTTIDGPAGVENISGAWICEFAELLAMVRAREVESIKAFLTRQSDKYRAPYARVSENIPRSCIFIGTTNEMQFMGDMTGNRRYLPVNINTNATKFFENIEEIKSYILECWREAFYKYINDEIYTTIPPECYSVLENMRSLYVDDNPVEGLIRDYIDKLPVGYELCSLEIFTKCLSGIRSKFTTRDSRNIATVMGNFNNWVRQPDRKSFNEDGYGQQRYWVKVSE